VFTNDDLDETFETMVEELKDWYPQLS
jgi:hypothetical protein